MTHPPTTDPPGADDSTPEAMLRRILNAVEKDRRRGWLEVALAVILSLATLASTWCGYQAKQWGGEQSAKQAGADTAERQAAEDTIVGLQLRTFDGMALLECWRAIRENDTETRDALMARMRPQLRAAIEASVAAGVLHDPGATGPMQRPEYVLDVEVQAKQLREDALRLHAGARNAGRVSGTYVLLTLVFASVLFFGGITGTFSARRVRLALACVALTLFVITIVILLGLPVSSG